MRTKGKWRFAVFVAAMLISLPVASQAPQRGEPMAVIVHKSNPLQSITFDELRKLCLAERRNWPHGRRATIALCEIGIPEHNAVLEQVYGMNEAEFNRYFLQGTFTGEIKATPKQVASVAGVRHFVFNVPGAIGFVRLSEVDDSVKVLQLGGLSPTNTAYPLNLPPGNSKEPVPKAKLP